MAAAHVGASSLSPLLVTSPEPGSAGPSRPAWMYQAHHMLEEDGRTRLSIACGLGDDLLADELLATGQASVSDRDVFDESCLHLAAAFGQKALIKLLVREYKAEVDARNSEGWTPLCYAFARGHLDCAKLLLKYKADGMWTSPQGWTLLHLAAWFNQLDSVRWLLDHNMDPNAQTVHGCRPFDLARPGEARRLLHDRMIDERATTRLGVPRPNQRPGTAPGESAYAKSIMRKSGQRLRA